MSDKEFETRFKAIMAVLIALALVALMLGGCVNGAPIDSRSQITIACDSVADAINEASFLYTAGKLTEEQALVVDKAVPVYEASCTGDLPAVDQVDNVRAALDGVKMTLRQIILAQEKK